MSLYRQLIGIVTVVISALTVLWLATSIHAARSMVIDNMQLLAQNGATSLAISMADIVPDIVTHQEQGRLSVLFDAVAHLGPYSKLYFVDLDDNRLIERSFSTQLGNVPKSFQRLIDLPNVEARASVSAGWTKLGNITVTLDPQPAYQQLWQILLQKLIWSLAIALSGITSAIILIRSLLQAAQWPAA